MYPAGGRKVFYLRKEQFIMKLSGIAHFVAWILSLTGDKDEEYYFELVAGILGDANL